MKCTKCNQEMRIGTEQVGVDGNKLPVFHRFGYCDNCKIKIDLDIAQNNQSNQGNREQPKHSTLSIIATVLAIFSCTSPIAFILALIDLGMAYGGKGKKNEKHIGSWFAIIFFIFLAIVFSSSSNRGSKPKSENVIEFNAESEENTSKETGEISENEINQEEISVGNTFDADGLKITINSADTDFTDYEDKYGIHSLDEGKKYIEVSFTFENNRNNDAYVSIYDFDCYADGSLCEQYYRFGSDFTNANISTNRNVSFDVYFVVPSDAESIELEYKSLMGFGDKFIIKIL